MRGWIVLAAVLLLLFLLGQLRLGAVGEYGPGGAGAWFRAGPVRIRLYPRRRSGPSKKEKAPKPGKEHPAGEARGGGLLELMKELLPLALEAAGCFRRRLRVDQLELKLTIGAADPGDAAIRYGQANALLGSIWQPLTEAFHVEEGRARVEVDFIAAAPVLTGQVSLSLKLYQLLWLGLHFGLRALSTYVNHRNRHKQQREAV